MKKRLFFCFSILLIVQQVSFSQTIPVKGKVIDAVSKLAIQGASVIQKGTSIGTVTDEEGNFSLSVPSNAVLLITSVNFDPLELAVNGKTLININLQSSEKSLDQVVVVGYGTQRRKDLTGAIASVSSKDIE